MIDSAAYMPHGYCLLWKPWLVGIHVVSDLLIFAAYAAIPVAIGIFLRRRKELELWQLAVLFAVFIMACGLSHLVQAITLWIPIYETQGWIKVFTAVVSVATAIAMFPLIPKALAIPKPSELEAVNAGLQREIALHKETFRALERAKEYLEIRVMERTRELSLAKARFETLVEASAEVVWTTDANGRTVADSPSWRAFTGQSVEEYKDMGWLNAIHPDDRERVKGLWLEAVKDRRVCQTEYRLRHVGHDGEIEWRWTAAKAALLPEDTGVAEWVGMNTDITARKRAESEIIKLNCDLELRVAERTAALEQTISELEAFAYSVSHDLRTPLRAIDGFSSLLLDEYKDRLDEEGQRYLVTVRENTESMGRLIDGLLAFSNVSRGEVGAESVDMGALAQDVFDKIRAQLPERNICLRLAEPPPARGNKTMIRQMMAHLIDNAIKFTKDRTEAVIEIGGSTKGAENVYWVKDNGAGFDMRFVDKLFGVFQRLHTKEEFGGTGIGLAIVKRIVDRHGGRVWAEGKLGEGTLIRFTLPAQHSE